SAWGRELLQLPLFVTQRVTSITKIPGITPRAKRLPGVYRVARGRRADRVGRLGEFCCRLAIVLTARSSRATTATRAANAAVASADHAALNVRNAPLSDRRRR